MKNVLRKFKNWATFSDTKYKKKKQICYHMGKFIIHGQGKLHLRELQT